MKKSKRTVSKVLILIFIFTMVFSNSRGISAATNYYVSLTGNDSNPGTQSQPFRTISKAIEVAQPGDTVMLRGGRYYERLVELVRGGTLQNPITFRNFPGEKPILDFGLQPSNWVLDSGSIFKTIPLGIYDAVDTARIVVDGVPLVKTRSVRKMTQGTFFVNTTTKEHYVWLPGGVNPTGKETIIINFKDPDLRTGLKINAHENIVIDGLTIRGAYEGLWAGTWMCWANYGMADEHPTNLTIKNTEISYCYQYALRTDTWDGILIDNCDIFQNGQTNIPRGKTGQDWPHAIIGWDTHNVIVKNSRIYENHGEGVGPFLWNTNWEIRNNEVYDNWSVNVYIDTDEGNCIIDGNLIYNTGKYFDGDLRNSGDGIRVANELADYNYFGGNPNKGVYGITITNNVIMNTGGGIRQFHYGATGTSYLRDSVIANNTVATVSNNLEGIYVARGDNVIVENNIVQTNTYKLNGIGAGITFRNNMAQDSSKLQITGTVNTSNMVYGDPSFVVGTGYIAHNYKLNPQSPAIDAGRITTATNIDYDGMARPVGSSYDIGAFEFNAGGSNPTSAPTPTPTPGPTPTPDPNATPTPTPTPTQAPTPSANLAFGKPAVACSEQNSSLVASNAVDGNTSTRWGSALKKDPSWIYVDLQQQYNIHRVVLVWEGAYAKAYEIQVSNDATNWTTVYSTTTGDGATDDITFASTNARYVRMYGTERALSRYGYSLWEFEIY